MSDNRFPFNGSGSVFNNNNNNANANTTRQHLYPGAFRNYPWGRNGTYQDQSKTNIPGVGRGEPEAPALSLGERVVWLRDTGPEIGTARWIGRLPVVSPDWTVGVEFDRPIGTGDGKFGTKQYFKTTPNHAFFLPIMTLLKADEYHGETTMGTTPRSEQKERGFLAPPRNKATWEKSCLTEEPPKTDIYHHHHHDDPHGCQSYHLNCENTGKCYHEAGCCATVTSGGSGGSRCFVTSTPRNATRHKSVTIKETVGNVPAFVEWSDEDELTKFPFKSWKSSSRQSVVSCPASVGPPTILIAKELTSDSSDSDARNGKFKTLMACFLPGSAHKSKKKKRRKYILASEKNKVSYVAGPDGCQPEKSAVLGAVSGGGDLWRNPRCQVRSVTGSCSAFPTHHCVSCQPSETVVPPPRKNFSCSGLEKLNAACPCEYPKPNATPITPLKKKTPAPAPPTQHLHHHQPISPPKQLLNQSPNKESDTVKVSNSTESISNGTSTTRSNTSTSSTRTHRFPVIRSLDAARNEIDISKIATKYTFVGNTPAARSNSFSGAATNQNEEKKELKPLNNNPLTISPHPRRNPKKKAPQPPDSKNSSKEEDGETGSKKEASAKKRVAPQPPELPKKTLPRDTMTLFGYTPREGGLSRTSSGATLETNLDRSVQSDGSTADLPSAIDEKEDISPAIAEKQAEVDINLASSSKPKQNEEDEKSFKILNTEMVVSKDDTAAQKQESKITVDASGIQSLDRKVLKEKNGVKEAKPTMKSSSSQTNLNQEADNSKVKKKKSKLLGGSKKKKEENHDEVTEILTEIEQVVKSKPTVQDFVAAFTKFTEKAEQIASNHHAAPVAPKPEPKPVKVTPPKPKLVPIPVVAPILSKEEKKSLKSFPTKWTFNFKSKEKRAAAMAAAEASVSDTKTATMTRNESSPCLESRSETVKSLTPQSSTPLSRKTYTTATASTNAISLFGLNDLREREPTPDRFSSIGGKDDSQNSNNCGPFIQNREALRRLSKENRHRHGSTLSLGRILGDRDNKHAADAYHHDKMFLTPTASPVTSRRGSAICTGKPPLPVKVVHDAMMEQNSKSANLFSQLEVAIANGQHQKAAILARELALQKVNGSLNRQRNKDRKDVDDKSTTVSLYIEDKNSHQGPIPLSIYPKMTVSMLKQKVEEQFNFKRECQRWILGKTFVVNDDSTMGNLDVCTPSCPIFLYIVAPNREKEKSDQAVASDGDSRDSDGETRKRNGSNVVSYEALTEMVNRMTAVTRNMLLAEELQKTMANIEEPLETLEEEENLDIMLEEPAAATAVESDTDPSDNSGHTNGGIESEISDGDDDIEVNAEEEESDDNNEIFEDAKQLNYQELVQLEERDLIANCEVFECPICFVDIQAGEGTILRDCLHNFCKDCLSKAVEYSDEAVIKCPFRNSEYSCDSHLLEREIKALVSPEMFEKHLQRSVAAAESKAENSFHCKSPDCPGWCLYEDNVNVFHCPVCALENCLTCQAIHEGKDCKQYQDEIEFDAAASEDAKKTKEYLDNMVKDGQATRCPTCRVIVMKKWGCDWLKCSVCQTEICWVTKGPRWGPGGRGDTSAGCKCGVNGIRCHTLCNYCH